MKKITLTTAAAWLAIAGFAQEPAQTPDTAAFVFTDVVVIPTNPVRDQNKSGTCWSFSTTSFLEDEVLHKGGPAVDLSDMFSVRHVYSDKADKYVRTHGKTTMDQGGQAHDVIYVLRNYGIVPEEAYNGLNYGEDKHAHGEFNAAMKAYVEAINRNPNRKLSTAWKRGFEGIQDAYLGQLPETFTYQGKTYTPQSFAKFLGLDPDDYVAFTSYTHHPFYQAFALEIPDNWLWEKSMNVPMEELKAIVDNALDNGYSVAWGADVSEGGFKWAKGYAVLPDDINEQDLNGTELSKWVTLSDADRAKKKFAFHGPGDLKEKTVTQQTRQDAFDNRETTDDHGMVIMGKAVDQAGNKYYKVKNSWDTNQVYGGYLYVSEPYFLEKTLTILVNKNAVPDDVKKKTGVK